MLVPKLVPMVIQLKKSTTFWHWYINLNKFLYQLEKHIKDATVSEKMNPILSIRLK